MAVIYVRQMFMKSIIGDNTIKPFSWSLTLRTNELEGSSRQTLFSLV